MKSISSFLILTAVAAVSALASCKNRTDTTDNSEKQMAEKIKNPDVVAFANLYCKTTDLDKARIFQGKDSSSLFTIKTDVENNYAKVYSINQEDNYLEFYMWIDKNGEKILGVNLVEVTAKGTTKSLQFFTFDSRLKMAVPCKRLNEIITNKMMSIRKGLAKFILRIPTGPENENITLQYWDRKDNYTELVFVWDGYTFKIQ
ncbi:MAG: hypothetical protein IKX26_05770 [Bacteroidales bacterium]|nr:hypothetical protein [Bacteroidales bacterium]MBR6465234.1 hypothetical protein [Bacteroidales bacterium]